MNNYCIAMTETLYYLKGIRQEDINKIPKEFIKYLNENCSKEYVCNFDYTKSLNEMELRNETREIIAMICYNWWCETDEQKAKFKKHLINNNIQHQKELLEKYNPDDIFKRNITKENNYEKTTQIVKYKEPFIKKIFNKIKNFFS